MDPTRQRLLAYVQDQRQQGVPPEHIRLMLLDTGWQPEQIDYLFTGLHMHQANIPPPHLEPINQSSLEQQPITLRQEAPHQPAEAQSTAAPSKYRVWQAVFDTFNAVRNNGIAVTASTLIAYGFATAMIAALYLYAVTAFGPLLFVGALGFAFAGSYGGLLGTLLLIVAAVGLWYTIIVGFSITITSLSLNDGAEHRRSSIPHLFKQSFHLLKRVVIANLLLLAVFAIPYILNILLLSLQRDNAGIGLLLGLVLLAWTVVALLRYPLVPYIAIFEPQIPAFKLLSRSQHLMIKGGQWFVFKGFLLCMVVTIAVMLIAYPDGPASQEPAGVAAILLNGLVIALLVIANGVLLMLYRNRRTVRG